MWMLALLLLARHATVTPPVRAPLAQAPVRVTYETSAGSIADDGVFRAPSAPDTGVITVRHRTLTRRVPVTVASGPPSGAQRIQPPASGLWLDEDFSRYGNIEQYRTNPLGRLANIPKWFNQRAISFTQPGYDGSPRALTYNWWGDSPAGSQCGKDITIATSYKMPPAREVWIEVVHKFASTFNTNQKKHGGHCSVGEYKFLLLWLPNGGRFDLRNGHDGAYWWSAHPQPNSAGRPPECSGAGFSCRLGYGPGQAGLLRNVPGPLWDDQWHTYRIHVRLPRAKGDDDLIFRIWIDGVLVKDVNEGTAINRQGKWSPRFTELFLGSNSNSGTPTPTTNSWGRLRIWTADPGW